MIQAEPSFRGLAFNFDSKFGLEGNCMKSVISFLLISALLSPMAFSANDIFSKVDADLQASRFTEARAAIEGQLKSNPQNADWLWRLSRAKVFLGDVAKSGSKEQEQLYQESFADAERAIQLNPDLSMAHVRRAISAGKIALFKGIIESKDLAIEVKKSCETALAKAGAANSDAKALAHYVLGRMHVKLTDTPLVLRKPLGLGWANLQEAQTNLIEALKIYPNWVQIRLEYGKALKKLKKEAESKEQLQKAIDLPSTEPGDDDKKAEAKTILAD